MKSTYDEAPSEWPSFDWMGKETLTALTYVLTVIQSLQNCQIDRLAFLAINSKINIQIKNSFKTRESWSHRKEHTSEPFFTVSVWNNAAEVG